MDAMTENGFSCRAIEHRDWHVVELVGTLDWTCAVDVRSVLVRLALPRGGRLAMDLRGLSFMDSTGIRLILQAMRFAEERGAAFAVIRGRRQVHNVLEVVGLDEQLRIVEDRDVLG
jgi:anti-anti-sigma factor